METFFGNWLKIKTWPCIHVWTEGVTFWPSTMHVLQKWLNVILEVWMITTYWSRLNCKLMPPWPSFQLGLLVNLWDLLSLPYLQTMRRSGHKLWKYFSACQFCPSPHLCNVDKQKNTSGIEDVIEENSRIRFGWAYQLHLHFSPNHFAQTLLRYY